VDGDAQRLKSPVAETRGRLPRDPIITTAINSSTSAGSPR
jgi:hypothetical protein